MAFLTGLSPCNNNNNMAQRRTDKSLQTLIRMTSNALHVTEQGVDEVLSRFTRRLSSRLARASLFRP